MGKGIKNCIGGLLLLFFLLLAHQIILWGKNLSDIRKLELLRGMPAEEAVMYMRDNKKALNIEDVRSLGESDKQWIIVRLRHVSILGTFFYLLSPPSLPFDVDISGLIYCSIDDNGNFGYCRPVE